MTDLPQEQFDIIYADPPWEYPGEMGSGSARENHYPTMPAQAIAAMPVKQCAAKDSLLLLWACSPQLPESLQVGAAWGFEYITVGFVWDKHLPVVGKYTMSQVELCLLFRRGKVPKPRGSFSEPQFLSEKRAAHSAKPLEIRRRIERMFPTQRKLELFARQPADGWTVWGNQANGERIRAQVDPDQDDLDL